MPRLIEQPTRVQAAGTKPKSIDEFVGRVNSGDSALSVALMKSPAGWLEPGQRPEFDEYTVVLEGALEVEHEGGKLTVRAGQAVHTRPALPGGVPARVQPRHRAPRRVVHRPPDSIKVLTSDLGSVAALPKLEIQGVFLRSGALRSNPPRSRSLDRISRALH
jgi:uncharacterized cupin superfamily protein